MILTMQESMNIVYSLVHSYKFMLDFKEMKTSMNDEITLIITTYTLSLVVVLT